jgi:transcriptional regulator with XRE-family HTH domain
VEAVRRLGVSQPYLTMLEEGKRPLTPDLTRRAALLYGLPLELPLPDSLLRKGIAPTRHFVGHLARLEYPGFAYVRPHVQWKNSAEVLVTALAQDGLQVRVAAGLPWLLLHFWKMDPRWLVEQARG